MITIKHPVSPDITYPLERIAPLRDLLFFDIETTGFSGDTSQLYLIGCVYHDGFGWKLIQWFADTRQAEAQVLEAFFNFLKRFKVLIHFNGDGFDIPYLLKCCRRLKLPYNFDSVISLDIYKKIKPLKKLLKLPSMKQKSIEAFLHISRQDVYSGGQLIDIYHQYLRSHEDSLYHLLILHNADDLRGMPAILPILSYADMMEQPLVLDTQELYRRDKAPFLHLIFKTSWPLPRPIERDSALVSLEFHQDALTCNVSLFEGELKYFYENYKDYYYLPLEDTAIHKSVGEYVDKSARKKATARTCYCRKQGLFLPQFEALWSPSLKEDYRSAITYVPYSPQLLTQESCASAYAKQLLTCTGCDE